MELLYPVAVKVLMSLVDEHLSNTVIGNDICPGDCDHHVTTVDQPSCYMLKVVLQKSSSLLSYWKDYK